MDTDGRGGGQTDVYGTRTECGRKRDKCAVDQPGGGCERATPLAPAPDGVQSKSDERGVLLMWAPPAENRQLPPLPTWWNAMEADRQERR